MKIAIIVICHQNSEQLNDLLLALDHPSIDCFVHIDKKASLSSEDIIKRENVIVLPDNYRVDVQWGKISLIDAEINAIEFARKKGLYDFFWICSGQDYIIKPINHIVSWFNNHKTNDFIQLIESKNHGGHSNNYDKRNELYYPSWMLGNVKVKRIIKRIYTEITGGYNHTYKWAKRKPISNIRFFFGSEWVCLTNRTITWIETYLMSHPEYYNYFKNCSTPDESFFQTLVMNSPYSELRMDYLHYIDWEGCTNNPNTFTAKDIEKLLESDKLMARKFDLDVDREILHLINKKIGIKNESIDY